MIFRSKPTIIEAVQFTDENDPPRGVIAKEMGGGFYTNTAGGVTTVHVGDWVIEEPHHPGKFYPCVPEVFEQRWEPALGTDNR